MFNEEFMKLNNKSKKENNSLKNEIINLKDKINEQIIIIEENKNKYAQENRTISEKEIKTLREKIKKK